MIQLQSALTTGLLVLGMFASGWLAIKNSQLPETDGNLVVQTGQATSLRLTQINQQGNPSYTTTATQATQYSDGSIRLHDINTTVVSYTKAPNWQLHADYGRVHHDNSIIDLWDQVHATRPAGNGFRALAFRTSTLTIYPNKNLVETDKAVTFYQPGTQNITRAVGMHANTKTKMIHLLSDVRSTYEASKQNATITQP